MATLHQFCAVFAGSIPTQQRVNFKTAVLWMLCVCLCASTVLFRTSNVLCARYVRRGRCLWWSFSAKVCINWINPAAKSAQTSTAWSCSGVHVPPRTHCMEQLVICHSRRTIHLLITGRFSETTENYLLGR